MAPDVTGFELLTGTTIRVQFADGCERSVDLQDVVRPIGVFARLHEPGFVASGRVNPDTGTIEWPDGGDVSPERLYQSGTLLRPAHRVA
jgi:hypothetical protein